MTSLGEGCGGSFHYRVLFCFDLHSRYSLSSPTLPPPTQPGEEGDEKQARMGEIEAQDKSCTAGTGMLTYFYEGNGKTRINSSEGVKEMKGK